MVFCGTHVGLEICKHTRTHAHAHDDSMTYMPAQSQPMSPWQTEEGQKIAVRNGFLCDSCFIPAKALCAGLGLVCGARSLSLIVGVALHLCLSPCLPDLIPTTTRSPQQRDGVARVSAVKYQRGVAGVGAQLLLHKRKEGDMPGG